MSAVRALVIVALAATPAWATDAGRAPAQIDVHFRPGAPDEILLGTTIGPLFSSDGGVTWRWMCDLAVGYGGIFDPDYVSSGTGAVIATTYNGLQAMRDGCVFAPGPLGAGIVTRVAMNSDGVLVAAMAEPGLADPPVPTDYKLYRSIDDGVTWDAGRTVGTGVDWWQSLEFAPSDPQRVYLTGYRPDAPARTVFLFRSDDAGVSFAPLPVTAFATTERSELEIAAISPTDPDRVLARLTWWGPTIGDAFFLSTDAGQTWMEVLRLGDEARAVAFRAADVLVGTVNVGIHRSIDGGQTFTALGGSHPDVRCFRPHPTTGELWACTENLVPPPFDYAVMKTADLVTWTGVTRLREIAGPVACPTGTIQEDCCTCTTGACAYPNPPTWDVLALSLGIPDNQVCPGDPMPDAPGMPPPETCCHVGGGPNGLLVVLVTLGLRRRRRP